MRKKKYQVGVALTPDPLSGDGYVATVVNGHPKVRHLFAFGSDRNATLRELARTIAVKLHHSQFGLNRVAAIEMIVADQVSYCLADLGIEPGEGNRS